MQNYTRDRLNSKQKAINRFTKTRVLFGLYAGVFCHQGIFDLISYLGIRNTTTSETFCLKMWCESTGRFPYWWSAASTRGQHHLMRLCPGWAGSAIMFTAHLRDLLQVNRASCEDRLLPVTFSAGWMIHCSLLQRTIWCCRVGRMDSVTAEEKCSMTDVAPLVQIDLLPCCLTLFFTSTPCRKSTFFNVLTKSQAAAENFPFCTIDPNESRVPVPDDRFDFLCQFHKPARCVCVVFLPWSPNRKLCFVPYLCDLSLQ